MSRVDKPRLGSLYVEQPYHRSIPVQSPFEKGFTFLKTRVHVCLLIALVASLVRVVGFYLRHFFPLPGEEKLLIDFLNFGSYGWLIMASFLVASEGILGRAQGFLWLGTRAVLAMPKVVLSLLCFLVALGFAMEAPPVVVFVLFLIWAPFFAAGEFYSPPIPKIEPDEDEQMEQDFYVARPRFKVGLFRYRSVWDLGFSRSVNFTSRNFLFTVQYALVLWVSIVGPRGLVVMVTGYYPGFGDSVVQIVLSSIVEVAAAVIGSFGMLSILPQEALLELRGEEIKGGASAGRGIAEARATEARDEPDQLTNGIAATQAPRGYLRENLLFLSLALFGAGATYCLWGMWQHQLRFPPGMKIEVERAEVSEGRFILVMKMEDERFNFRTLRPEMFRLDLKPTAGVTLPVKPQATPAAPEPKKEGAPDGKKIEGEKPTAAVDVTGGAPEKPAEPELPAPSRAIPYSIDGVALPEDYFAPYSRPIRLNLYFNIGDQGGTAGEYTLYYLNFLSLNGEKDKVVSGKYGSIPTIGPAAPAANGDGATKDGGAAQPSSGEAPQSLPVTPPHLSVAMLLSWVEG